MIFVLLKSERDNSSPTRVPIALKPLDHTKYQRLTHWKVIPAEILLLSIPIGIERMQFRRSVGHPRKIYSVQFPADVNVRWGAPAHSLGIGYEAPSDPDAATTILVQ